MTFPILVEPYHGQFAARLVGEEANRGARRRRPADDLERHRSGPLKVILPAISSRLKQGYRLIGGRILGLDMSPLSVIAVGAGIGQVV